MASFTRLAHILEAFGEFSLFTDHNNILYLLSPSQLTPMSQGMSFKMTNAGKFDSLNSISTLSTFLASITYRRKLLLCGHLLELRFIQKESGITTFSSTHVFSEKSDLLSLHDVYEAQKGSPPKYEHEFVQPNNEIPVWRKSQWQLYVAP